MSRTAFALKHPMLWHSKKCSTKTRSTSLRQKPVYVPSLAPRTVAATELPFSYAEPAASESIGDYSLPAGTVAQEYDENAKVKPSEHLSRPRLVARVKHGNKTFVVFNAHLKSKLHTYPGSGFSTKDEGLRAGVGLFDLTRRAAEAATLRARVTAELKQGHPVIVVGDLNDGPHAATTEILYGPPGSQLSVPEDAPRVSSGFSREDDGDPQRLFNVTKLVPEPERWSRKTNNVRELIDHVLSSAQLLPRKGDLRTVPKIKIHNAELDSIGEQPRKDSGIPDHAAIVARFDI
jgi:endonuclease/exonuclease/phosphatase family metal-dependent hydrolase